MAVIAVFGGTSEGRSIGEALKNTDITVHMCTVTEYGTSLVPQGENIITHTGAMNEEEMENFFDEISPQLCIDATHPYAQNVTENIINACEKKNIENIRVLRAEGQEKGGVIYRESVKSAVEFLKKTEGNIFITTGSNELEKYCEIDNYKERCTARVLSSANVIEKCRSIGFEGKNLICMQGPFSEDLNYCMFKEKSARWIVTKNSGSAGGYEEKCNAAQRMGAGIIVIGRKTEKSKNKMFLPELIDLIKNKYGISIKRKAYIIGAGTGKANMLTGEAKNALEKSDVIIGAERVLDICSDYKNKAFFKSYKTNEIVEFLNKHNEYKSAALVFSGDIGFYSGAKKIREQLNEFEIENISGISSPVYFLNKLGLACEDVEIISCHGQSEDIIKKINENEKVCTIIGRRTDVSEICIKLLKYNMGNVRVSVGERLSYDNESIVKGNAEDFVNKETDTLSVVVFENDKYEGKKRGSIRDGEFIRGNVPMTKEEIRTVSLSKLKLDEKSVLYDIGAGTGSVSVEASKICKKVYAVEKNQDACKLIEENRIKFKCDNIEIIKGSAPEAINDLEMPTHVFIGGSSGKIKEITDKVIEKNENAVFVINAITLETVGAVNEIKNNFGYKEVVQINTSRGKYIGGYTLMNSENPVYIFTLKK